jgi:molybdate transport system substrate-binding protein
MKLFISIVLMLSLQSLARGEALLVAVAANFLPTAKQLQQDYQEVSGLTLELSAGSTGKLYTQINYGAPYEVYLAADTVRPGLLEASGKGVKGSGFIYATGHLVLWSKDPAIVEQGCLEALLQQNFRHLALANTATAPYGFAAMETLQHLDLWEGLQSKLVNGESVGQVYQYLKSGNAQIGFIAASQARLADTSSSCWWPVPADHHAPLQQQAVIVNQTRKLAVAQKFMSYLQSDRARSLIKRAGYSVTE